MSKRRAHKLTFLFRSFIARLVKNCTEVGEGPSEHEQRLTGFLIFQAYDADHHLNIMDYSTA